MIDRHYTHCCIVVVFVVVVVVVVVLTCALWITVLFNDSPPLLQRPPHQNDMAKGERGLQMRLLLDT